MTATANKRAQAISDYFMLSTTGKKMIETAQDKSD